MFPMTDPSLRTNDAAASWHVEPVVSHPFAASERVTAFRTAVTVRPPLTV